MDCNRRVRSEGVVARELARLGIDAKAETAARFFRHI